MYEPRMMTPQGILIAATIVAVSAALQLSAADEKADQNVTLQTVSRKQYEAIIQKHKGKVVLVDFWATWCVPCLQGYPKTLELARELKDDGLVVISVSMDEPDADTREQVLEFLKKQKSTIPNLISSLGGESEAMEAFDIDGGSLPHYKVYDRSGRLVKKIGVDLENPSDKLHEQVDVAVREALRRPAGRKSR